MVSTVDKQITPKPAPWRYHPLPKQVSRQDFNHYIAPHLNRPVKGPAPKLSVYKLFNYILYVLHTGIQWNQLQTRRNEDRKSTRLNSSHIQKSRMPSSA